MNSNNYSEIARHARLCAFAPLREFFLFNLRSQLREFLLILITGIAMVGCARPEPLGPVADPQMAKEIRLAIAGPTATEGGEEEAGPIGTGWATLRGQFTYPEAPPEMRRAGG